MRTEAEQLLAELVKACDDFEETINFYMDDAAWDALDAMQRVCERVREYQDSLAARRG